jgi:hypothetical protein
MWPRLREFLSIFPELSLKIPELTEFMNPVFSRFLEISQRTTHVYRDVTCFFLLGENLSSNGSSKCGNLGWLFGQFLHMVVKSGSTCMLREVEDQIQDCVKYFVILSIFTLVQYWRAILVL